MLWRQTQLEWTIHRSNGDPNNEPRDLVHIAVVMLTEGIACSTLFFVAAQTHTPNVDIARMVVENDGNFEGEEQNDNVLQQVKALGDRFGVVQLLDMVLGLNLIQWTKKIESLHC